MSQADNLASPAFDLTGVMFPFTGATPPTGTIFADGGLYSRATYPNLWAWVQATSGNVAASDAAWTPGQYSPDDGSTTFRVPKMNGRVPVGVGGGGGGANTGSTGGNNAMNVMQPFTGVNWIIKV